MNALLQAAVAIGAAGISHPAGEPRGAVLLAIHRDHGLLPGQAAGQSLPKVLGVEAPLLQPGLSVAQLQARSLNPDQGWADVIP